MPPLLLKLVFDKVVVITDRTVLDETAELFDTVLVSGGRRGFDIELAPADLIAATGAITAAIGR